MSHGQTAADVRALVARRCGTGRKVALLSADHALVQLLSANGAELLVDPPGLEAVAEFAPQVVVAFDGLLTGGPRPLVALQTAAPKAELLLSFNHAGAAAGLVRALAGKPSAQGFAPAQVREWLQAAGYRVASEDLVVMPPEPSGLATDAEVALRQLFEQLNPQAVVERFLWVAEPGAAPVAPALVDALVSVVLAASDPQGAHASLTSLERQVVRPFEVVVVGAGAVASLERHARDGLELVRLERPASAAAAWTEGAAKAKGRFLALWLGGELADRSHLHQLRHALEQGVPAWATSGVTTSTGPALPATPFDAGQAFRTGQLARVGCLFDRRRLGALTVAIADGVEHADSLWLARVAAVFPAAVVQGPPSATGAAVAGPEALAPMLDARPLRALAPLELRDSRSRPEVLLHSAVEALKRRLR